MTLNLEQLNSRESELIYQFSVMNVNQYLDYIINLLLIAFLTYFVARVVQNYVY